MLIDLDAIPRREPGLEPFEVMISESQERMVAIVEPARWEAVREVCDAVGPAGRDHRPRHAGARHRRARPDPTARARSTRAGRPVDGARELARIPAAALASGAIVFQRESRPPARRRARPGPRRPRRARRRPPAARPGPGRGAPGAAGLAQPRRRAAPCTSSTTTTSRRTPSPGPGRGAAVLRIKGTTKALVASTDANAPVGVLDPWLGAAMSVAEAARNVAITGARPLGVTNCLNFGDPTRPEAFWQLSEAVRGLSDACIALGLPVTGGNVSLYNESPATAIAPTPEIGVVGLLDDVAKRDRPGVPRRGQRGPAGRGAGRRPRGQRVRAARRRRARGRAARPGPGPRARASRPSSARRSTAASSRAARTSPGAASRWRSPRWRSGAASGRTLRLTVGDSPAVGLFGESPSRLVCEVAPRHVPAFILLARQHGLPGDELGFTGGSRLVIELGRRGRDRRGRGAGQPDRRRAGRRDRRPAARVGPRPATGARLGVGLCHGCQRGRTLMCGVVGVVLPDRGHEAAAAAATALFALQHRGQESAGVGVSDGRNLMIYKDLGMVSQVLDERRIPSLAGRPRRRPLPLLDDRARRSGRTPSRRSASARGGRWRSATTATSSTPASCSTSSRAGAVASPRAPTRSCSPRCSPTSRRSTRSTPCAGSCRGSAARSAS